MADFIINQDMTGSKALPSFQLTIKHTYTTTIYSDTDMQNELVTVLRNNENFAVFDQKEGLYERLSVEDNLHFYRKWFDSKIPLAEVLVLLELQSCTKKPIHKCSESEKRRVYFAKYLMSQANPLVIQEPIHGVDIKTVNSFLNMLEYLKEQHRSVLVLVSNLEHALLLGDTAYKLQENGLQLVEIDEADKLSEESKNPLEAQTVNLFKIPAKVDDKMILFDPLEIDYIESQDGKAMIVINEESYALDFTLTEIEKKLEIYGFYRCHRSYIVNLQKVREIITWSKNTYSLRVDNKIESTIPLSRTKIQDIQEKFNLK